MVNEALINPESIAIIGASNNPEKPGGRLVMNLINGGYKGRLLPVNTKETEISGLKVYNTIESLPPVSMAILAIPATACIESAELLVKTKSAKALIIVSAGFSETGSEGKNLEEKLKTLAAEHHVSILGPNCMGIINNYIKATFVSPPPPIVEDGVDFVSASGALAVFFFDLAALHGLRFGNIISVGNSIDTGVEEVLKYWDETFKGGFSSLVKLVYVEQIKKPDLFFTHIQSLRRKGCHVLVQKPGDSEAGARAALSHTGALAGDASAYGLLIEKAGAIRCNSREELVYLACLLSQKELRGKNIAIVSDAGGPAVMLADQLNKEGLIVPELDRLSCDTILKNLNRGASAANPIDMLSTCTREQLSYVVQYCDKLDYIDGIITIYGNTGMEDLYHTFSVLKETIDKCQKPVFPVLPSVCSAQNEIKHFTSLGHVAYFDEVVLAQSIGKINKTPDILSDNLFIPVKSEKENGNVNILDEEHVIERLRWAGIPMVKTIIIKDKKQLSKLQSVKFPVAAKVLGVLHKTEVGGVILNINNDNELHAAVEKLWGIEGSKGVLIQQMIKGTELFLGGKKHAGIGYSVHAGMGGIFVELLGNVASRLAPVNIHEAKAMLSSLKAQKLFKGFRNLPAVDFELFASLLVAFSNIFSKYPDIEEIDINPLIANGDMILAVDARIITK